MLACIHTFVKHANGSDPWLEGFCAVLCFSEGASDTSGDSAWKKQIWKSYFGDPGLLGAFSSSVHADCWDISSYRTSLPNFFTMYHSTGSYPNSAAESGEQLWKRNVLSSQLRYDSSQSSDTQPVSFLRYLENDECDLGTGFTLIHTSSTTG